MDDLDLWFDDFLESQSDENYDKLLTYLDHRDRKLLAEFMDNNIDALYRQAAKDLIEQAKESQKLLNPIDTTKYLN